jgi:hypothetical protein
MIRTCAKSNCKPWGLPSRRRITDGLVVHLCKRHDRQLTSLCATAGLGVKRPLTQSERLILWRWFRDTRYFDSQKRLSSASAKMLLHLLTTGKHISDEKLLAYRRRQLSRVPVNSAPQTATKAGDIKSGQRLTRDVRSMLHRITGVCSEVCGAGLTGTPGSQSR